MPPPPVSTYGADSSGLICGFLFGGDGKGLPIDSAQACAWLADEGPRDGFAWLHFNLAHATTGKWLREHVTLSEVFHDALREGSRSTRIELDDDMLVAVVNDVNYDFAFEPSDISTLWLLVTPRLVVSVRMAPLRSIDRLRAAVKRGASVRSTVDLLGHLMHDQSDVLVDVVRSTTARIDDIEDHMLTGRLEKRRADLGTVRRLLVRLQRLLAPEPAALFRLLQKPPAWIGEDDLQDLRQATEEVHVVLSDMAVLQERIKLLHEEIAARVAEENNRSLFVLTTVTVLALPINLIAGLMGMNVGGIPLAQHPHGFWIVVCVIATFTGVAGWIAFRKKQE